MRPRYGRRRAACLLAVHVLIAAHIVHWKLAGRTLAPLELNEVMHTLELGVVTAGFLLMLVAVVATAIFGRFFCSWGCHILALEDLCAWWLARFGVHPRPLRSRLLVCVPSAVMFYMFVWPQLARWIVERWPQTVAVVGARPDFRWRVLADADGWASFVTTDFARNLPGPGIALITLLVCGFAIVYLLGSRAFCAYVCPYGAVFALADRVAPGSIVLDGDCTACGRCTAACSSNLRVHEEIARFGKVVSPSCMKDFDCVSACPEGVLRFGFAKPAGFSSWSAGRARIPYSLTWPEELLLVAALSLCLLVFRGLYDLVPLFLALGTGVIVATVLVVSLRLVRHATVRLGHLRLKVNGRWTWAGQTFRVVAALLALLTLHSATVRYHEILGQSGYRRIREHSAAAEVPAATLLSDVLGHLQARERWGLIHPPNLDHELARVYQLLGSHRQAAHHLQLILVRDPANGRVRMNLARSLAADGRVHETEQHLLAIVRAPIPEQGEDRATRHLRAAAHFALGGLLADRRQIPGAVAQMQSSLVLRPDFAPAQQALQVLLRMLKEEASTVPQGRQRVTEPTRDTRRGLR